MVSPTSSRRIALVTFPVVLKLHSMYPLRVGGEAIQKVHSPSPNTEYSPNCPAEKVNSSATFGSWNESLQCAHIR